MLAASSNLPAEILITAAVIIGPLATVAIYWFGLRSARRHDENHR